MIRAVVAVVVVVAAVVGANPRGRGINLAHAADLERRRPALAPELGVVVAQECPAPALAAPDDDAARERKKDNDAAGDDARLRADVEGSLVEPGRVDGRAGARVGDLDGIRGEDVAVDGDGRAERWPLLASGLEDVED